MKGTDKRTGEVFGNYELQDVIGRGGMGVVFRAKDVVTGAVVAVKLMAPDLAHNDTFRERFIREAQAGPKLNHPNIVRVFETGEAGGELFIAMQLIEGVDLKGLIEQQSPLDPKRVLSIFRQAADALDAAHESGLVHRDVKPQNILVIPRPNDQELDQVFLTDFGLVRPMTSETSASRTGQVFGSVAYMAPEIIEGIPADGRADVYALGCVLYECLTGSIPFERDNEVSAVWAHIHENPPAVTDARPDLPGGLNDVVIKAMQKHPDDRFLTCGEIVSEFEVGLGRKRGRMTYSHARPLIARIPHRKTEREVWSPNFFPELSRVRWASRERFDWRKAAALVVAVLTLSGVQVGREGGLPQAVADVADAAGVVVPSIIRVLNPEEDESSEPSRVAGTGPTAALGGKRGTGSSATGGRNEVTQGQAQIANNPGATAEPGKQHTDLISFSNYVDGDWEIFVVGTDGSGLKQLTDNAVDDWGAAWSPDGQFLVFARGQTGDPTTRGTSDLYTMRWDGSDVRRLTSGEERDTDPSWSSTGKIAFARDFRVFVIDPDGSNLFLLNESGFNPDWSSDSRRIVYLKPFSPGGTQFIWTVRSDGSQASRLTDPDNERDEHHPAWAPDGKTIAFVVNKDPTAPAPVAFLEDWIVVSDMAGVTTDLVPGGEPDWSPDGRWILFDDDGTLKAIRPDGTGLRVIYESGFGWARSPAWRPRING
ncbi:MAG: serine/threonine-protein kinase [Actinobacteria bacterium]|nr:serine/threonine-protein kinase [Actinomycetota bacterium]